MTVRGSQLDHTTNKAGRFINPFHSAPSNVDQINYPDSKSFSVKLDTRQTKRAMPPLRDEDMDWMTRAKNAFYGQSANYKVPVVSQNDHEFIGPLYVGSQKQ